MAETRLLEDHGLTWQVTEGEPSATSTGRQQRVLLFRSGLRVREFSPAPADWREATDERLRALLRQALDRLG
jgi:hypothetical protein